MNDPKILADEYKERFEVFKRYREISALGSLKGLLKSDEDKAQWQADLWCIWWIYMEHSKPPCNRYDESLRHRLIWRL
jgi:hypothetical protein